MTAYVGTSGFSYAQWKGVFYPEKLANARMLAYYAERLPSVELNNTFYRLPRASALASWRDTVPAGFSFAVKAPRAITHFAKLSPAAAQLEPFLGVLGALGDRGGPVLFQLPPTHQADPALLRDFLDVLPTELRAAFEFRHPSWFSDEVLEALSHHGCALVGGDLDDAERSPPLERTAPFAYLRLRRSGYEPGELESWAERIRRLGVEDSYVYFKHEQTAPALARDLLDLLDGPQQRVEGSPRTS